MSDIRAWLEELGLGDIADVFEAERIGIRTLPNLSEDDLRELGLPMGPRKEILRAAAGLTDLGTTSDGEPSDRRAGVSAERRQLTVMFCDLVGSTALSEQLDPEDLRTLMAAYQRAAGTVIERYDGHVAQYLGDGLMTYFGWPRAHEDDAERAVRAGLGIVDAVRNVAAPEPLRVRIGIATGPVVVGETGAGDAAVPKAAVGETPNVAARVQALADADQLVIADSTYRLTRGAFDYHDLGEQSLKGVVELVHARRVLGTSAAAGRFAAQAIDGLTPLVGRDSELAMMTERWARASDGDGQVVLLSGEPGIGKSRIVQALTEVVREQIHVVSQFQCSPYHTNSTLYPVVDQLEREAGFARDDSNEARLNKLEAVLASRYEDIQSVARLFASLLSLDTAERYPETTLPPQEQREQTLAAIVAGLVDGAPTAPVLVIFEDVHWADPTTLEVLDSLIETIERRSILVVVTFRPEFAPPWAGRGYVTLHGLTRLGRRLAAQMTEKVAGVDTLSGAVRSEIVAKTDGVPLFVEELTKAVIESGSIGGDGTALSIPLTLRDSLMARLDRMESVKDVAQIGACIGREFPFDVLACVSPMSGDELQEAVHRLVDAELIFSRGTPPNARYTFKHALVQDAAYESLLKSRRAELHAQLAAALIEDFPETAAAEPETVARHLTEAGQTAEAIEYWERAGIQASQRSSNVEAIAHLERALSLISDLPQSAERAAREMRLLNILAAPLMNTKGYAAPESGKVYDRISDLCKTAGDGDHVYQALSGASQFHCVFGNLFKAQPMGDEMLALAEKNGDADAVLESHRLIGLFAVLRGDFARSVKHLDTVRALFDPAKRRELALFYGQDHEMSSYVLQSMALAPMGYLDRARANIDAGIAAALKSEHAFSQAYALAIPLITLSFIRDVNRTEPTIAETIEFCTEHSVAYFLSFGALAKSFMKVWRGDIRDGITQMRSGIEQFQSTGAGQLLPQLHTMLAEALMRLGDLEEAKTLLDKSTDQIERWGEAYYQAETIRVRGELHRCAGDTAGADACYRDAIAVAQNQEAKLFELRAATDLARLWHGQGKTEDARDLLAPVYDWFTEGFDTADLKDAKALLDELG